MNSLSWVLYLADVLENVGSFLEIICFLTGLSAVFCAFFGFIASDYQEEEAMRLFKIARVSVVAFVVTGVISCLMPTKQTMYAVAASEVGEEVLKTPTAGKAVKALNNWLDKQLEEKEEEK